MARRSIPQQSKSEARAASTRASLSKVAAKFAGFSPAASVLTPVRSVPTIFPWFDWATRVDGLPIERFTLLHGPSNEGKTYFTLGLEASFLSADHLVLHLDAERTTPITWVRDLMGPLADHPLYFAERPTEYEATVKLVRKWLNTAHELRSSGKVAPDTAALIVCDSIRKLVPKGLLDQIMKLTADSKGEARNGARGRFQKAKEIGGRAGQIKAALNAQWMDELIPLLERSQAAFVAISREAKDPNADQWAQRAGDDYTVGGGAALVYDASLRIRVSRANYVQERKEGEEPRVFGERHQILIKKTKVARQEGKTTRGWFHTSNGVLVPPGFDRARDALSIGLAVGVVGATGGSWLTWKGGGQRWNGEHAAVRKLAADEVARRALEREARSKFSEREPPEWEAPKGPDGAEGAEA